MKTQELTGVKRLIAQVSLISVVLVASSLNSAQAGWRLECAGRAPAWSVEVYPKALKARVAGKNAMLPILSKRQAHGNRNKVAIKTQIRSRNQTDRLDLTLTFTKNCRSSVNGKLMTFHAKGNFNQTSLTGCCRAVRG